MGNLRANVNFDSFWWSRVSLWSFKDVIHNFNLVPTIKCLSISYVPSIKVNCIHSQF